MGAALSGSESGPFLNEIMKISPDSLHLKCSLALSDLETADIDPDANCDTLEQLEIVEYDMLSSLALLNTLPPPPFPQGHS